MMVFLMDGQCATARVVRHSTAARRLRLEVPDLRGHPRPASGATGDAAAHEKTGGTAGGAGLFLPALVGATPAGGARVVRRARRVTNTTSSLETPS
ncbi:hypothetical protein HRD49_09030 [Corallococcus exiguus]|uniref:hypothetical protein n=1 Tax=Corallococcus TaxID=83461 RepID=UPI000EA280A0|nr:MULTISPECIES: hypothetical protein [Corallococcus]NNC15822.1 hypothetical protein [Corallococcus exiguus]NRD53202.1 hypothetical protein [Corallococcus exiguus]NRD61900.1 hypothetical protein [Corallococcus exiguus]RKH29345.1 hypothetical protein D7V77_06090 [Corallococcus sp. CA041A]